MQHKDMRFVDIATIHGALLRPFKRRASRRRTGAGELQHSGHSKSSVDSKFWWIIHEPGKSFSGHASKGQGKKKKEKRGRTEDLLY